MLTPLPYDFFSYAGSASHAMRTQFISSPQVVMSCPPLEAPLCVCVCVNEWLAL